MLRITAALFSCLALTCLPLPADGNKRLLFRNPTVSQTELVFEYANDLWIVSRDGGEARRLTSGVGREFNPHFSPDGTQVAFSGEYDGNIDVYVIPASGGVPRRLTYHPGPDVAIGWTPDGKRILFNSGRDSYADSGKLYTIGVDGTLPEALPLPAAEDGCYSSDGSHIAYVPAFQWQTAWKKYRGGQTMKIWLADLSDSSIVKIPRENSNDFNPDVGW
jgi:tricorn protease